MRQEQDLIVHVDLHVQPEAVIAWSEACTDPARTSSLTPRRARQASARRPVGRGRTVVTARRQMILLISMRSSM
jgi:hypothetical protein